MQAAVQAGGSLQRASSSTTSSQQSKADTSQSKGKKRERPDQSQDACKRERSMKVEETVTGPLKRDGSVKLEEVANIADKDGGLTSLLVVDQILQLVRQDRNDYAKESCDAVSQRNQVAGIIAATEEVDCLTRFVQLGGLLVLDDWLQDAHKGRPGDGVSLKDGDKGLEELMLSLLRALDKLPVDLHALKGCSVGKSVNNLRSHKNLEIQKKARKLVDTWKKRVDAEMKSSGELKHGSNPLSGKQPSGETFGVKGHPVVEGSSVKSITGAKLATNNSSPSGVLKCGTLSVSGSKEVSTPIPNTVSKDSFVKPHVSGTNEVLLTAEKEEKSSCSSQSPSSQSWSSVSLKGAGSGKEEVKTSSAISTSSQSTTNTLRSHNSSGKGYPTTTSIAATKDLAGGKQSAWNKMLGIEKVASPLLMEKGTNDNLRSESLNNHRIIVRLPNPGRSPVRGVIGVDGGNPASRGSSPGLTERQDPIDAKSKNVSCAPPAVQSSSTSGDLKIGNGNCSGAKSSVDFGEEKEKACSITLENGDCISSDAEQRPDHAAKPMALTQASVLEKGLGSSDMSLEVHKLGSNESGIDLLASVAACEGSEAEKGVIGEGNCRAKDFNTEPLKYGRHLHVPDHEGHIKAAGISAGDSKEQPGVAISPQGLEERVRGDAFDSTLVSSQCPTLKDMNGAAVRTEAFGSQDGCDGGDCTVVRRDTTNNEEKGSILLADTHFLSGDCQTGTATVTVQGLDDVSCLEEGLEIAKKARTNSPECLVRMSSVGNVAKGGDFDYGYYEEDALEVARQVAKEVEQEVEGYSKPEAQDASKMEPRHDSPAHESATSPRLSSGEDVVKAKGCDKDRVYHGASDDSQETVTEKMEETDADTMPSVGNGEEVDQASCSFNGADKSRSSPELVHGSFVDDMSIREAKEPVAMKENEQFSSPVAQDNHMDATVCGVQAAEASVPDQAAALASRGYDGNGESSNALGRPVFDLNEGFVADDTCHDDPPPSTTPSVNAPVIPDYLACPLALPSAVAAPIAVLAAAKGGFIPPSNLLRAKADLGWKGSAATSAFRPAEPRRATESPADTTSTEAAADATGQSEKHTRNWVIDLNVADERVMEDTSVASSLPSQNSLIVNATSCQALEGSLIKSSSAGCLVNSSPTASRLELDLNRADESEESMVPTSDSRVASIRMIRDFDLNDGPGVEEPTREEPPQLSHCKDIESLAPISTVMRANAEVTNAAPWYPVANPLHTTVAFSASRAESAYPVAAAPMANNVASTSHTLGPYTGFPFASTSYNISSMPYVASTSSPSFATGPSQLVSAGSVASPYGRPYLMGVIEVPGAETSTSWSRPSLDLNAGPDSADIEGLSMWQVPSLGQLSFQQAGPSAGPFRKKEPEGGFDPLRSGFKQMTWR